MEPKKEPIYIVPPWAYPILKEEERKKEMYKNLVENCNWNGRI